MRSATGMASPGAGGPTAALRLALALSLILLLASACGGGGGGATTPTPKLPPDASDLQRLAFQYVAGPEGRARYRYETVNYGEHPQGVWTVYRLGENYRLDWESDGATTAAFILGDEVTVCTQTRAVTSCVPQDQGVVEFLLLLFSPISEVPEALAAGVPDLTWEEQPREEIAGAQARCFQAEAPSHLGVGPDGSEKIHICFSEEGMLLSMERAITFTNPALPESSLSLKALEVGDATPADFELLKEPVR